MKPRIIGAGVGRTGTASLQVALEQLLGGPCYHMREVFQHPEHIPAWHAAAKGDCSPCVELIGDYLAAVDWPASAFWPDLAAAYPDALILLSVRDSQAWWDSASETIFSGAIKGTWDEGSEWGAMMRDLMSARFTSELTNREQCICAFEKHNSHARETAPSERLVVWQASDGWEPLCKALGVPVPDNEFPRVNTKEQFLAHLRDA